MKQEFMKKESAFFAGQYYTESQYWLKKLSGDAAPVGFPTDFPWTQAAVDNHPEQKLKKKDLKFPDDIANSMLTLSNGSDIRLHIILVAGIMTLLHRYNPFRENPDITIGSTVLRQETAAKFINTVLVFRHALEDKWSFRQLLKGLGQTMAEATQHQNYPMETLLYQLQMPLTKNGVFSLFDTAVLLDNIHERSYIDHIPLNLLFNFYSSGSRISGTVEFNGHFFRETTVTLIIKHLQRIFQEALENINAPVASLQIQSEAELKQLLYQFNARSQEYPAEKNLHGLFEEQVERTPGAVAIIEPQFYGESKQNPGQGAVEVTYQDLNQQANRLAHCLCQKGVGPDVLVAVIMEHSVDLLVVLLGVLKAGGAYLPLDREMPLERIRFIIRDSNTRLLICREKWFQSNTGISELFEAENIIPVNSRANQGDDDSNPVTRVTPSHLGYVIYTSGTTGRPKGVMVPHRGLVNYLCWSARTYQLQTGNSSRNFLLYSNISFDLTVTSLFAPLITGHSVIIYRDSDFDGFVLDKMLEDKNIRLIKLTPSHLKTILQRNCADSTLKGLIVGGESLDTALAGRIQKNFADRIEIYNEYGPTETVVGCMVHKFDPLEDRSSTVPIGVPAANTKIYLLYKNLVPVPMGAIGELYIAGDGVARGYLNNPHLTMEKFVANPFETDSIMYCTGDLARFLHDGNIEFLGRKDKQVKIRGHRIEPAEIEVHLCCFKEKPAMTPAMVDDAFNVFMPSNALRCSRCLLSSGYPGIRFDEKGECSVCKEFDNYKSHAFNYFNKDMNDLYRKIKSVNRTHQQNGDYDCLLLFSGGKDSSYALYRLVEQGLRVMTFTFDNGYISDTAFDNIRRITSTLNVPNIISKVENIKNIFVESLKTTHNVCHGCWNALNVVGAEVAGKNRIHMVISGLSRGQVFDMKLHGLFRMAVFNEDEIEERLRLFQRSFHSENNRFARLLKLENKNHFITDIRFEDFFRYDNSTVQEIREYLADQGWVQPKDTGFCSSNCLINDVGIFMHLQDEGYHSYETPLSWDCRLGGISREEGLKEMDFVESPGHVKDILEDIGYFSSYSISDVVVTDMKGNDDSRYLCAYYVAEKEFEPEVLRNYLAEFLPPYMIPSHFIKLERIPLTVNGKTDKNALPLPQLKSREKYMGPTSEIEKVITRAWADVLKIDRIGIYDNFFDIGGDSVKIINLFFQLKKNLGKEISAGKLFQYPTVASLAKYVENETAASAPLPEPGKDLAEKVNNAKSRLQKRRNRGHERR